MRVRDYAVAFVAALMLGMVAVSPLLVPVLNAGAAPRTGSYASQRSSGWPLMAADRIVEPNLSALGRFKDATLEIAPFLQSTDGKPRPEVPLTLRSMGTRVWLYVLVGDQWLPPAFTPQSWDRSGFRDIFDAVNRGNGWLYDTSGGQWFENYRVNLADSATVRRMGDVYTRVLRLGLVDGILMDDCHTSIAWTSKPDRPLDVERAGFATLAAMDSSRKANIERLIVRLHAAGGCGFLVCINGTGPKPKGTDMDFREGLGSLISVAEAKTWMASPGKHWLKAEAYTPEETATMLLMLKQVGGRSASVVSLGPGREWPPVRVSP